MTIQEIINLMNVLEGEIIELPEEKESCQPLIFDN